MVNQRTRHAHPTESRRSRSRVCCRIGVIALPPTTITNATLLDRDAASGATQPPSLSPQTPTFAGSTPGWARSASTAPSVSVGEFGVGAADEGVAD